MSKNLVIYIDRHQGIDSVERFIVNTEGSPWKFKGKDLDITIMEEERKPEFATQEWVTEAIKAALLERSKYASLHI